MARVHFLDGTAGIGGTKLLYEDLGVRLLIDFGCNYDTEGQLYGYDSMLKRSKKRFKDRYYQMRALGLLPEIPTEEGAEPYFTGHVTTDAEFDELPPAGIDAVLLTHAHHDHDGNVPFLSPRVPLYGTVETLCFFAQKYDRGYKGKHGDWLNHFGNNEHWRSKRAAREAIDEDAPVTFADGRVTVTPVRVDHSIPGACGYLIDTSDGKTVAISGDFRLHGTNERRKLSEHFVELVRERGPVDLLIVEGTNIDEFSDAVEEARGGWSVKAFIKAEAERAFARGGMVVVGVSGNNIERIDSIYEVCRELDARLHMSVYNASVLERLRKTGAFSSRGHVTNRLLDKEHVVVYERYGQEFYKKFPGDEHGPYVREHIAEYGKERGAELKERAVMLLYDGDIALLTRIKPPAGSKYVRSAWEAFTDEQRPNQSRLERWCERYGMGYHHIHASGHAYGAQLKEAIAQMGPRNVAPIHTEKQWLFGDVLGEGGQVLMVSDGEVVEF